MNSGKTFFRLCNAVLNFWNRIVVYDQVLEMDCSTFNAIQGQLQDVMKGVEMCIAEQEEINHLLEMDPMDGGEDIQFLQAVPMFCASALNLALTALSNSRLPKHPVLQPLGKDFIFTWHELEFVLTPEGTLSVAKPELPCDSCYYSNSGAECVENCYKMQGQVDWRQYDLYKKIKKALAEIGMEEKAQ